MWRARSKDGPSAKGGATSDVRRRARLDLLRESGGLPRTGGEGRASAPASLPARSNAGPSAGLDPVHDAARDPWQEPWDDAPPVPLRRRIGRVLTGMLYLLALIVVVGGVGFLGGGFLRYLDEVERFAAPALSEVAPADAIVVLTGGPARLAQGGRLLEADRAPRLLVTGVNEATTQEQIEDLLGVGDRLFGCCVTLDFEAHDTIGNARETAEWLAATGEGPAFAPDPADDGTGAGDGARVLSDGAPSVIVVTSNYHMQRALRELRRAAPGVRFEPVAVMGVDLTGEGWWRDARTWRLLLAEYAKSLLAAAREYPRLGAFFDRALERPVAGSRAG